MGKKVIKQEDGNIGLVIDTNADKYYLHVPSVKITFKGDTDKDLRITYSTSKLKYTKDRSSEWIDGVCTIEEVDKKKRFGLFEQKHTLFEIRGPISWGNNRPGAEIGENYSAARNFNRKRLDDLMEYGKVIVPQGLQKMDENLAKIEKQARELAALQIELINEEHKKKLQLKQAQKGQKQTKTNTEQILKAEQEKYNAQRAEVVRSFASQYSQEDYATAIARLTTKVAPKEEQTPKEKPSNSVNRSNYNMSAMNDGQRE